jgi:mutual gliding-motility protein MglA
MVFFNWATMQMAAKIVYYGPGLCGKTTNLSFIYAKTSPGSRGEMVSLETETDRTLFFDLLPLEVGKVGGFRTRLQLYTVPGQVFYNTTRKLVLKGVDGLVFVADSQRPMAEANVESFRNLEENLRELGVDFASTSLVLQYNKRDLRNILSVDELNELLNPQGKYEFYEAVAVEGDGVFETLKAITKLTLKALRKRMATQEGAGATIQAPAPPPPPRPQPVSFDPNALQAAAQEGLSAPTPPPAEAESAAEIPETAATEAVQTAPLEAIPPAPDEVAEAQPHPDDTQPTASQAGQETSPPPGEAEDAAVEFATTADQQPPPEPEVRHVKVSSSLDILSELDNLRKVATGGGTEEFTSKSGRGLDLDSLLAGSVNSRQEVRRKVEHDAGDALARAARCIVRIELVDEAGEALQALDPVPVELKRGEHLSQLQLSLNVNIRGE